MRRLEEHIATLKAGLAKGKDSRQLGSLSIEMIRQALSEKDDLSDAYIKRIRTKLVREKLRDEQERLSGNVRGRLAAIIPNCQITITRLAGRRALVVWLDELKNEPPYEIKMGKSGVKKSEIKING